MIDRITIVGVRQKNFKNLSTKKRESLSRKLTKQPIILQRKGKYLEKFASNRHGEIHKVKQDSTAWLKINVVNKIHVIQNSDIWLYVYGLIIS